MALPLFLPWSPPANPLGDETIVLRLPRDADAPAIAAACADPEIARWIPVPVPYRLDDARSFVAFAGESWRDGREPTFIIHDRASGALAGTIAIHRRSEDPGKAAVGYWIAAAARRRGIATRATRIVAAWAFEHPELVRLELLTLVGNDASGGVALAAGFTHEGRLRRYLRFRGELVDAEMYAVTRDEVERGTLDGAKRAHRGGARTRDEAC